MNKQGRFNPHSLLCCLAFLPAISVADTIDLSPSNTEVNITCPISLPNQDNTLTNFGDYIAGYGTETVFSQKKSIYFTSDFSVPNAPIILVDYFNASAVYNSTKGTVSCIFQSIIPTDPIFSVHYQLTNGLGGTIVSQTSSTVNIALPVG